MPGIAPERKDRKPYRLAWCLRRRKAGWINLDFSEEEQRTIQALVRPFRESLTDTQINQAIDACLDMGALPREYPAGFRLMLENSITKTCLAEHSVEYGCCPAKENYQIAHKTYEELCQKVTALSDNKLVEILGGKRMPGQSFALSQLKQDRELANIRVPLFTNLSEPEKQKEIQKIRAEHERKGRPTDDATCRQIAQITWDHAVDKREKLLRRRIKDGETRVQQNKIKGGRRAEPDPTRMAQRMFHFLDSLGITPTVNKLLPATQHEVPSLAKLLFSKYNLGSPERRWLAIQLTSYKKKQAPSSHTLDF